MARQRKRRWHAASVAALVLVAGLTLGIVPSRRTSNAQEGIRPTGPLIARGYTDAPSGSVELAGDPWSGGTMVAELKVANGQKVAKDQVVAVLWNYATANVTVRTVEAELQKAKRQREAMVNGWRTASIALQEVVVNSAAEELKLKRVELSRSSQPPDTKQLEISISQQSLEREQVKLRVMKQKLASDLALTDIDISVLSGNLDAARINREQALVRSPLDGVVVQIYTRKGESIPPSGIVKIVDMGQLRVLADLDVVHLGRVVTGGKVEVAFRGSQTIYRGTITRIAAMVKRIQRTEPGEGSSTDARVVQVEIQLDAPSDMPQMVGREARVTFL